MESKRYTYAVQYVTNPDSAEYGRYAAFVQDRETFVLLASESFLTEEGAKNWAEQEIEKRTA